MAEGALTPVTYWEFVPTRHCCKSLTDSTSFTPAIILMAMTLAEREHELGLLLRS
jgi:hypothetical protein